jgi:hypothetical protein
MNRKLIATLCVSAALVVAMGVAPAAANGPPVIEVEEFEYQDVNPCTGEEHTFFVRMTVRIHEFDNEGGNRHHYNTQVTFEGTTSDGFAGTVVGPDVHNHTGPAGEPSIFEDEEGTGMFAGTGNGVFSNKETGQRFRYKVHAHFTLVNGVVKVDNFSETYECLGKGA